MRMNNEVALPRTLVKIKNIFCMPPELHKHKTLKKRPAIRRKRQRTGPDQTRIDNIQFFWRQRLSLDRPGKPGNKLNQIRRLKMRKILKNRRRRLETNDRRELAWRNQMRRTVQQQRKKPLQRSNITNTMTHRNIPIEDIGQQLGKNIVITRLEILRKTTRNQIRLKRRTIPFFPAERTILRKRKRKQLIRKMPTRKPGTELPAQQRRIRPGNDNLKPFIELLPYIQFPVRCRLNFVKKKQRRRRRSYQGIQQRIVGTRKTRQPEIVKVQIKKGLPGTLHKLMKNRTLSAPPDTGHNQGMAYSISNGIYISLVME